jgi:ribonuclease HII
MRNSILKTIGNFDDYLNNNIDNVEKEKYKYKLLIDGNYFIPITYINNKDCFDEIDFECVIKGDNTFTSIAAASILAKVERDNYINEICDKYPLLDSYYKLRSNKGYGSAIHMAGITTHGITKFHRKTFGRCKVANMCDI